MNGHQLLAALGNRARSFGFYILPWILEQKERLCRFKLRIDESECAPGSDGKAAKQNTCHYDLM